MSTRRPMSITTNLSLTLAAALATALAALTLWSVFQQQSWFWAGLLAIAVVAAVGFLGRAIRAPRPLVLVLQVLALIAAVCARFAPTESSLGFIPTGDTVVALRDLLDRGFAAINDQAVPVLDVPGIALITMLGVGAVAVAVDVSAVALRSPVVAGAPLLGLYAVPSAVLPGGAPWDLFAAAAAAWLLLIYVDHRAETRAWGVPMRSAQAERAGWERGPIRPHAVLGRRIAFAAVAGALVVSALPLVGDGVVGDIGEQGRGGDRDGTGRTVAPVSLDLGVTLKSNLESELDLPVLSYATDDGTGQYLRLTVLDTFDGISWQPAPQPLRGPSIFAGSQDVPGLDSTQADVRSLRTEVLTFDTVTNVGYLPMPYTGTSVDVARTRGEWQWDRLTSTVFSDEDEFAGKNYVVESASVTPSPQTLAATEVDAGDVAGQLTVPADLPAELATTAAAVTANATSTYGQAIALQRWFRENFVYDLDIPATDDAEALTTFLTNRRGFCQQFAATYALMARSIGVPSRVVVGFAPGDRDENTGRYLVGTHDYHAWPEIYFGGVGWVRFEPTPRSDEDSTLAVPSWATSTADRALEPAPETQQPERPERDVQPERGDASSTSASNADVTRVWTWSGPARVAGGTVLVLVLALAAVGPAFARRLRRRRRVQAPAGPARVEAAWAELGDTARDLGLTWSETDTPRRAADALVREAGLSPTGSGAVQTLRLDIERTRYAGATSSGSARTNDALSSALDDLDAVSTRGARLRARLLPRTIWRTPGNRTR